MPISIPDRPLKEIKQEMVKDLERRYLEKALQSSGGNITQAARASRKPRRVFFELMRKHGIRAEVFRGDAVRSAFFRGVDAPVIV